MNNRKLVSEMPQPEFFKTKTILKIGQVFVILERSGVLTFYSEADYFSEKSLDSTSTPPMIEAQYGGFGAQMVPKPQYCTLIMGGFDELKTVKHLLFHFAIKQWKNTSRMHHFTASENTMRLLLRVLKIGDF